MTSEQAGQIEYVDPRFFDEKPVISVIMLVYNHGEYLANAIESVVQQQADEPFELLIGEDRSTDASREIAVSYQRKHPGRIRIITAEHNVGAHRNWMRLTGAARGEFIAHVDGDDYWLPGKLALQLARLRARPEAAAVYSNAIAVDRDGKVIGQFNDVGDREFQLSTLLRRGNFLCMSTMVFRAVLLPELRRIGDKFIDYEMHLTHARHGVVLHCGARLAAYRVGSTGSALAHSNDLIRDLYWQAINSVPRSMVSDADYACAVTDFLRRVFFRAVRTVDVALLRQWVGRVYSASPYGVFRTSALFLRSVVAAGARWVNVRLAKSLSHARSDILYP